MTLEEAIKHCEEVVEKCDKEYMEHPTRLGYIEKFYSPKEYGDRYNQLADWLKELKKYRQIEQSPEPPKEDDADV